MKSSLDVVASMCFVREMLGWYSIELLPCWMRKRLPLVGVHSVVG